MNSMPRLQDAEVKYFESRGEEVAPSLLEESPAAEPDGGGQDATDETRGEAGGSVPETKADKEGREGRFVPLQALQEERAEKKQLREELRQYREWQAQLTQRLQQVPLQMQASPAPDPIRWTISTMCWGAYRTPRRSCSSGGNNRS